MRTIFIDIDSENIDFVLSLQLRLVAKIIFKEGRWAHLVIIGTACSPPPTTYFLDLKGGSTWSKKELSLLWCPGHRFLTYLPVQIFVI